MRSTRNAGNPCQQRLGMAAKSPAPGGEGSPVLCGVGPALPASNTGEPLKARWPFRRRAGEPGSRLQERCALQCHHD